MHKDFSEWYRLVALEPDGTKLQKRWAGVKAWAAALRNDDESVLETVRIFQGIPSRTSREGFLGAFQKQDSAFPQRNELELQVLAGASLVACIQSVGGDGEGLHTALLAGAALEASSLRATEPRLNEIAQTVLEGVQAIAAKQRVRKPFDLNALEAKAGAAAEAMKQIPSIGDWPVLKNVVTPIFQALVDAVRAVDVTLSRAAQSLRAADEETNILWWAVGGCSRDTNMTWDMLKHGAAIVAGVELADLTDIALGPCNAAALLERVLSETDSNEVALPLDAYVNALPDAWVRDRAAEAEGQALDLTPVTLAIVRRGESDIASWQQFYDASSGIKATTRLSAARVARQAYVEAILLRALASVDTEE